MELISGAIVLNVKQKLREWWQRKNRERASSNSLHVSDLLGCRRKTAFTKLNHDPPPMPSDRQIRFFHNGVSVHRELQDLLGEEFDCEKEIVWTR